MLPVLKYISSSAHTHSKKCVTGAKALQYQKFLVIIVLVTKYGLFYILNNGLLTTFIWMVPYELLA